MLLFVSRALAETGALAPDVISYLLRLGPVGALVVGAFMLGKGVRVAIVVTLSDPDRALLERGVKAAEGRHGGGRGAGWRDASESPQ